MLASHSHICTSFSLLLLLLCRLLRPLRLQNHPLPGSGPNAWAKPHQCKGRRLPGVTRGPLRVPRSRASVASGGRLRCRRWRFTTPGLWFCPRCSALIRGDSFLLFSALLLLSSLCLFKASLKNISSSLPSATVSLRLSHIPSCHLPPRHRKHAHARTRAPAKQRKVGRMPVAARWLSGPSHGSPDCCAHQLYTTCTLCICAGMWSCQKQTLGWCEGFWLNMRAGETETATRRVRGRVSH